MTSPDRRSATFDPAEGHPQRWWILAVLCLSLVLVVVSVSSLNVALPSIQQDLDTTGSDLQWIIDSYALVFAGLLLPFGALGDRYGRRRTLTIGLVMFALVGVGASQAQEAWQLIAMRGVQGAAAALIMPSTLSLVTTVFSPLERPKAIAVWAGFAGAGGAIGPISSGLLLKWFWWGSVFLLAVPIVIVSLVGIAMLVPTSKDPEEAPLDLVGSLLSIFGLGSLIYAIIEGPVLGWSHLEVVGAFVLAAVLLVGFVLWELRIASPMLDPRLFKRRRFSLGTLTITTAFFAMFGMFFVITLYFQFAQGHTPLDAGARTLPAAVMMVIVAPRSATLAARFGARVTVSAGFVVVAAGLFLMSLADIDTPYVFVAVALMLMATGMGIIMPPTTHAIVDSLPPSKAGVGSAVNDTTREVGGSLGIALLGSLLASGYRSALGGAADGLPEPAREAARSSIGEALFVARDLPADVGGPLVQAARDSFDRGMNWALIAATLLCLVTAGLVAAFYPKATVTHTAEPAEPVPAR